jgi:hypothetical protein
MPDLSLRFGANSTYYIQFRQMMSVTMVAAPGETKAHWVNAAADLPGCTPSTTGQDSPRLCFASCTAVELVNQNQYTSNGFPRWYSGCPNPPYSFELIEGPGVPGQYNLQNARTAPGCTYDQASAGQQFPPTGNCFGYRPGEWVTYSYKISLGTKGTGSVGSCNDGGPSANFINCYYGNDIQLRMGRDGQPTEPVVTWTGPMNAADPNRLDYDMKYGKIWINAYSKALTFPSGAEQYFDELIMSQNPIPDPGAGGGTVAAPTTIRLSGGY